MYEDGREDIDLLDVEGDAIPQRHLQYFESAGYWVGVVGRIVRVLSLLTLIVLIFAIAFIVVGGNVADGEAVLGLLIYFISAAIYLVIGNHLAKTGKKYSALFQSGGTDLDSLGEGTKSLAAAFRVMGILIALSLIGGIVMFAVLFASFG